MNDTWLRFPYAKKPLSDSTLKKMTKDELIEIIRDYEHNYEVLYEANERGIAAAEKALQSLDSLKTMKRITLRDNNGYPYIERDDDRHAVVARLATLEDATQEMLSAWEAK